MTAKQVRDIIRRRLKATGMTVAALARAAHLPDQTVRDYLDGKSDPASDKVFCILSAVGIVVTMTEPE
jgi:transcriptional regulator with XRE-family HTH domain